MSEIPESLSNQGAPRRPTMQDVARLSGHSLSTVDRVLSGRLAVRADTAQRVREAAEQLGFRAAGVIRERLSQARTRRRFGFLLPTTTPYFYQPLADALAAASAACPQAQVRALVERLASQAPDLVAERMLALGASVDSLAVVSADHPAIAQAIEQLAQRGVPVFALISDLGSPARAGYAGLDNRRVGRTAAWFLTRLAHQPGPLAVLIGTHRFQCQELCEMSFRSYVREHAPRFELCETRLTLEHEEHSEEAMRDVLRAHPDLAGFYVGGGGIAGVLRALRRDAAGRHLPGVAHDLAPPTRDGLLSGQLDAVLSHPLAELSVRLVAEMDRALREPASGVRQVIVPLQVVTPESL